MRTLLRSSASSAVWMASLFCVFCLTGCASSKSTTKATVEDRSPPRTTVANVSQPPRSSSQPSVGRPAYHVVVKGDTLMSISRQYQVDWRALQRANDITDPNQISLGRRLTIPGGGASSSGSAGSMASSGVVTTPLPPSETPKSTTPGPTVATTTKPVASKSTADDDAAPKPSAASGVWQWPLESGQVVSKFGEGSNKGIDIAAPAGTPVFASAGGKVIFSSNNIRGYGNLIVLRHDNEYLTAYGYNSRLLVKEGDVVKKGDKIAEVGSSGTDSPKLHFEVRNAKSKPEDPLRYLPKR